MRYLGLDLGGTNVKAAVIEVDGDHRSIVGTARTETHAHAGPDAVAARMVDLGEAMRSEHGPLTAVGIGVPGLFDFSEGTIVFFTNLPGAWEGFPLRTRIADGLELPATLINDARAFTLAEAVMGAGEGCRTVACITLGTGVGGGLAIDGQLHFGHFGIAGELGHQTVEPDGRVCGCGNPGCMEAMARPVVVAERAGTETFEQALAAADAGDATATTAVEGAIRYLGIGLANVVTMFGPERIVIGGGGAEAGPAFIDRIQQSVRDRVTLVPRDEVHVVAATLGSTSGAVGAALAGVESPARDRRFQAGEIPSAAMRRDEISGE